MLSQTSSQPSSGIDPFIIFFILKPLLIETPSLWKSWKLEHPEFQREYDTKITYPGDKILILGGVKPGKTGRAPNLILVDPENQTFKIIPSTGDADSCCCSFMSACYWKDSKVVVFGGLDSIEDRYSSTVAIITLKDLDSESKFLIEQYLIYPF